MTRVAGVDSSTQACKVVVRDAATGELVREGRAPHPAGTEVDPAAWAEALTAAVDAAGGLSDVAALAVGGQQHGMVCLDERGEVVRPALLWNDVRSAGAAADLVADLGDGDPAAGRQAWADAVGLVPVASFTGAKLRWLADAEPANADRTAAVCLPHDWLTWRLSGAGDLGTLTTDRGDASGTAYWSARTGEYRLDLLELALRGRRPRVPRVAGPAETVGTATGSPTVLGPGSGDNAAAALGLAAREGDVVVSIGTSGVVSAVTRTAVSDPSGIVAGFADATGRHLPLVCTLNAARVLDAAATLLGVGHATLSELALSAPPGADGLVLVPYLEGERTPDLPAATGSVHGLTLRTATPAHLARAAVEGLLCGLADGIDAVVAHGVPVERVLLVGGGARSAAVQQLAPAVFGRPVVVPPPGEYVADGAARQAAWVLSGAPEPPDWPQPGLRVVETAPTPSVRERYAEVRDRTDR
ncbi:FGGY-family carbohydrate kinase [Geodermatophilus sp. YIM 151500]|uniref:xylulokinase n=1 Tax=Geodermatophilus sp. YIM 151500 TaxID=2984531 RepID=UPI0021E45D8D|nr:FGGY-family carbohydrate kinase [Geodermatophilus sp. YIM 151500]MCV2488356.1 FGGY-family carbohydrate kinase [Geodermatophilus sp. YIM 151500]